MLTPDLRLQVTYPLWVGSLLHSVPLLLILASLGAKACRQSRAPGAQHFSSALLDGKGPPAGGQPPLLQAALPLLQEVRPRICSPIVQAHVLPPSAAHCCRVHLSTSSTSKAGW